MERQLRNNNNNCVQPPVACSPSPQTTRSITFFGMFGNFSAANTVFKTPIKIILSVFTTNQKIKDNRKGAEIAEKSLNVKSIEIIN